MRTTIIWTFLVLLTLSGCAPGMGPKESGGTLLGAGTGALLGAQLGRGPGRMFAMAAGTMAGAIIGQEIGRSLDQVDRWEMQQNFQTSLESSRNHVTSGWKNPDNDHSGTLTPLRTYQTAQQQYCREYLQTVTIGGKESQAYGTACREPDGSWKITN